MKKKLLLFIGMISLLLLNIDYAKADYFGLEISPCESGTYTMNVGDTVTLESVVNTNSEISNFEWSFVGDTTINVETGKSEELKKITALKSGAARASVTYTLRSGEQYSQTCNINVQEKDSFIIPTCGSGQVILYIGDYITLEPLTDKPENNIWTFGSDTAVEVTPEIHEKSRTIRGMKEGMVPVTVENGSDSYTCKIFVRVNPNPKPSPSTTPTPTTTPSPSPSTSPKPSSSSTPSPSATTTPSPTTKPVEKSTNNNLKSLSVDGYSFDKKFTSSILEYTLTIPKNIKTIKVSAKAEDSKATIKGVGNVNINSDNEKLTVTVTSESGDVKEYRINIIRKDFTVKLNSISVSNFNLNETFNSEKTAYTLTVPNDVTTLDIKALADNEDAIVTITGNDDLVVGKNIIRIEVKNSNLESESTVYTLTVTREKSEELVDSKIENSNDKDVKVEDKKDNNSMIIIGSVIFVLLSIGVVVLVVINNKKKKSVF